MLKNLSNLGNALNGEELKSITGGLAARACRFIGCAGKSSGDICYNASGCQAPGTCQTSGGNLTCTTL